MKIGFIRYDSPITSGGYFYDDQLVSHLRRQGATVRMFLQKPASYAMSLLGNYDTILQEAVLTFAPDALIEDELNHPSLFLFNRRLLRNMQVPVIALIHHLNSDETEQGTTRHVSRIIEKQYLRTITGFIAVSGYTGRSVRALAGRDLPCCIAVPGRDRLARFVPAGPGTGIRRAAAAPMRILYAGAVIPRKGLESLVQALDGLEHVGEWELTVVGDDRRDLSYTRRVRKLIRSRKLDRHISWQGRLGDRELAGAMLRSDLLAVPSRMEGFGMIYAEAFGMGLPVIAGSGGGAVEIVEHENNGFIVDPDDVDGLRKVLRSCITDPALLPRMSAAAFRCYGTLATWEVSMENIRQFLQKFARA